MSFSFRPIAAALAALALLPLAALAQQGRQANPGDADAPVPATAYVSAFANYRAAADEEATPDQVWRIANQEVADAEAHSMQTPPPATDRPAPPRPDPHAGHGAHHTMQGK